MIELTETVLGFLYDEVVEFPHDSVLAKHPAFPLVIVWRFTECNSFHKLPVNESISIEVIEDRHTPNLTIQEEAMIDMFGSHGQLHWFRCKWVS
jgi:hypothetical protein